MTASRTPQLPDTGETLAHRILGVLALHRMATTTQLLALLAPGRSHQLISRPLRQLARQQLVDHAALPRARRQRVWFLTPEGARTTRDWPELRGRPPYPITPASAVSPRTAHTLTVLRTHQTFAADARRRGDEHGPYDWTPEVAHHLPDSQQLIADALLHYTAHETDGQRSMLRAFIEVDRATMSSERLATKLIEYARFHDYTPTPPGRRPTTPTQQTLGPAWQRWYPVFPRVLFILTGTSRTSLANRIADLKAMTAEHPYVTLMSHHVPLGAAVLEDLEHHGPSAPIWTPLNTRDQPMPWMDL